jgi:5-oxopent-3-ene-1,2,5-tricarboxylate decarboxylase/2-hydroxyhepta-2,4-diene-1,7-dioate isomerase
MTGWALPIDVAPWRLSGTVVGTLLNDPATLAAVGDDAALAASRYKAAPRAPVLYVKPRNTLSGPGAEVEAPEDGQFEAGAALGLVIGRTACRVPEELALSHLAGYMLVLDLSVPHDDFYRPSVRLRARDGSCVIGPAVVARGAIADPGAIDIAIHVDGRLAQVASTGVMRRPAARLIAEVSEFMTLHPGDILMLGVAQGAPRARAGQRIAIEAPGLGRLEATLVPARQEAVA